MFLFGERIVSILLTGATGFIGKQLVGELIKQDEEVHILCRPTSDISGLDDPRITIFSGDVTNLENISNAMQGCDCVYHLAALAKNWAPNPDIFDKINVTGTNNILSIAEKLSVEKVVITSTSMTLKSSEEDPVKESDGRAEHILTDYARSKARSEDSAMKYCERGLEVVFVNPTRVFGPGLMTEGNSATLMIQLYMQGKWRYVLGDGNAIGNYGFVDDIVTGHIQAMQHGKSGELYTLGGENLSFNKFFEILAELSEVRHHLFHIPLSLIQLVSKLEITRAKLFRGYPLITPEWVEVFSKNWAFSCAKAEKDLEYRITPFREALSRTINWIKD